jgi:hypothetical protein
MNLEQKIQNTTKVHNTQELILIEEEMKRLK